MSNEFDIIVVGGGHAGAEAAWAASGTGARVALVTLSPKTIGVMSCNPAIGGLAKGQIVREIDALGGLMGLAADASGIMFKMLNTSKGAAVHGPRAQCDRHAYAETVQHLLRNRTGIELVTGAVLDILIEKDAAAGVSVRTGTQVHELRAPAVVLTTGTFMRGLMHTGDTATPGGRATEAPATNISESLQSLSFELGRLKTGTPPRLRRGTIEWDSLEPQFGDEIPAPFSDLTPHDPALFPMIEQVDCRITRTTPEAHAAIRSNLHRAPLFSGKIQSAGPRYCPSIEDKVVRFEDRDSHHVFLEPESLRDDAVYCNGISSSLPTDIQDILVRTMPGCAHAEIIRYGYAVEYDMVRPHQIDATCMTKSIPGLFFAGQINGTSGYEEAAGQGLLAGINASRHATGKPLVTLGRDQAYIGVMMDDLVTKTPVEPYRMFTSRAEHRLILRADNAADRLTPIGQQWGTVCNERAAKFKHRQDEIKSLESLIDSTRIEDKPLAHLIKRPGFTTEELSKKLAEEHFSSDTLATVLANRQYAGYIVRQQAEIRRQAEMERRHLAADLYLDASTTGLRAEAREALTRFRPRTFGQASRIEGVNPSDLSILLVHHKRKSASRATTSRAQSSP